MITDEMVEKAAIAGMIESVCGLQVDGERVLCDDKRVPVDMTTDSCVCRVAARAALTAVAPMIRAQIGEELARMVDDKSWSNIDDARISAAENRIADAIRAATQGE